MRNFFQNHLNSSHIEKILVFFDIASKLLHWEIIPIGYENVSIKIVCTSSLLLLRIYNPLQFDSFPRTKEHILYELEFIEYLHMRHIPVVIPYKTNKKEKIYTLILGTTSYYCVLFPFIEGGSPSYWTKKRVVEIAKLEKTMHAISGDFHTIYQRQHSLITALPARILTIAQSLPKTNDTLFLGQELSEISHTLLHLGAQYPLIPVHRDIHEGNLLYSKGQLLALIDFDDLALSHKEDDVGLTLYQIVRATKTALSIQERISLFFSIYPDLNQKLCLSYMYMRTLAECVFSLAHFHETRENQGYKEYLRKRKLAKRIKEIFLLYPCSQK